MIHLQEHQQLILADSPVTYCDEYNDLNLILWDKPTDNSPWGYYASFKIGAEWINDRESLIVTPKQGLEHIDFLKMFSTCFASDLALESFSKIYTIDFSKPPVSAPSLQSILSPLIIFHFLGIIRRIKSLKKGYVKRQENLKKIKGHICILKNERSNIIPKRFNRAFCKYQEYSVDIPENRLLKKALIFSQHFIEKFTRNNTSAKNMNLILSQSIAMFNSVSDNVNIREVGRIKSNKLFSTYNEAIRLAKLILQRFDYSITKVNTVTHSVPPFTLDMSLLYEHYVYGLLNEAYKNKISYQFKGRTGYPDFLYKSDSFKAILDTKYIPKYANLSLETYVIRQLSGYSRDLPILKHLGYDLREEDLIPTVPCIIIYPENGANDIENPFKGNHIEKLCSKPIPNLSQFYKISVPVPIIHPQI